MFVLLIIRWWGKGFSFELKLKLSNHPNVLWLISTWSTLRWWKLTISNNCLFVCVYPNHGGNSSSNKKLFKTASLCSLAKTNWCCWAGMVKAHNFDWLPVCLYLSRCSSDDEGKGFLLNWSSNKKISKPPHCVLWPRPNGVARPGWWKHVFSFGC